MTERTPANPSAAIAAPQSPIRGGQEPSPTAAGTRAKRRPLLGAFPLVLMTLATFLVLFALMMARLQAGADPALRASGTSALVAKRSGAGPVKTHASGSTAAAAGATPAAIEGSRAPTPAVVTRSSGATGLEEAGDD